MPLSHKIRDYTNRLAQDGLLRTRFVSAEDSSLIHFDSNDYLSLARDKRISEGYQRGYALYPSGSGASMVLSGYHPNHRAVEEAFANLLAVDDCILFSSGYAANLAVTALLGRLKVHCFIDKEIHASIYDGLALSQVNYTRYLHNNLDDLSRKFTLNFKSSALITEGIFSMSGQLAPLLKLSSLCIANQGALLVDEAHSFGILGNQGRGATAYHGLTQNEVPLRIIPLGKAYAAQGALVAGKADWIYALLQAGRSIIYSTAVSPALSYGLLNTLEFVVNAEDRRSKLAQLITLFRSYAKQSPLNWTDSISPIQQLQLGCPHLALHYARELKKQGISCCAIRKPTVSVKASGLRVILNYNHTPEQIRELFKQISVLYEHKHP
ncbi:aminotransferase class I/II-fold pyridoxal phosphate-dependent enzyme [Fluoribacter gormanii]|uniref:8-amino-7-oxononanoate synthase n=1 Tax=Fluoribacter gormanii TaxID=464 RepID=A0A377GK69_9GAMM|nr:aminotransferase class I/II-fold pyridoxal phosphate-dependent enzyme [Fluoribacter gormanii]KTD00345.1 8-amino-7-oxononanoate synthase [Fluoribacter gormanii]MCW8443723.1 aminotransferase class I/II-fold pyridoxal phosphate-dependent enzyme [Fluoribacter gormanii]MCW8472151.1 aminotransferase class I/II-fold pyridoxal phosphate-dependent enzyme [Fluoribacter gormanii]SIQ91923.1 8-amino-7-oxononanoate synthase [Fluoribacter gormanii]STO24722.1 8-amino-7-oxononanoate synthase [Fluoribacter g